VTEIKTVPYVPLSHPFVERLIGTFVVLNKSTVERNRFAVAGSNPCLVLKASVRASRGTGSPYLA
jgi:hypothetical protein